MLAFLSGRGGEGLGKEVVNKSLDFPLKRQILSWEGTCMVNWNSPYTYVRIDSIVYIFGIFCTTIIISCGPTFSELS